MVRLSRLSGLFAASVTAAVWADPSVRLTSWSLTASQTPPVVRLPNQNGSLKFAVVGNSGSGTSEQQQTAEQLSKVHQTFPFDLVLLAGNNVIGSERPQDFAQKFERPYKSILDAGVTFRAVLGNHDDPNQRFYKPFSMDDKRFYAFMRENVEFFALDSNFVDKTQLAWLENALRSSQALWKVAYFHHPLYSSAGSHGSTELGTLLEPLFERYGVKIVFTSHDEVYERTKPQHGITYFVVGSSGLFRRGDLRKDSDLTAKGFDTDNAFLVVEIAADQLVFNAISRSGKVVDSGVISRR